MNGIQTTNFIGAICFREVELILEKLAAGETAEQILDAHPRLTREAIREALAFAAKALRADVVSPISEANV
jgi:uncharacterized protein (DUF433 family)